jgi:hypothetical protein
MSYLFTLPYLKTNIRRKLWKYHGRALGQAPDLMEVLELKIDDWGYPELPLLNRIRRWWGKQIHSALVKPAHDMGIEVH